jgi:hypothetical protein
MSTDRLSANPAPSLCQDEWRLSKDQTPSTLAVIDKIYPLFFVQVANGNTLAVAHLL